MYCKVVHCNVMEWKLSRWLVEGPRLLHMDLEVGVDSLLAQSPTAQVPLCLLLHLHLTRNIF